MAIANADGSIVLTTKVDDSGLKQSTRNLKSEAAKLAAEYRKAGMSQSEAMKKAWSEIDRTKKSTDKTKKSTKEYGEQAQKSGGTAKSAFSSVGSALKKLAIAAAAAFSVQKIIQFSAEASNLAATAEASVQRLIDIYGSASQAVGDFIDANAQALGMSRSAAANYASVYGNLFSVWADQATNAELTNRYLNMTAVVASKTGRTVEDVQERIRSGLLGNTEAIEDLGVFVNVKTIEMTDAFQRMANGKSWEQLDAYTQQQIRSMAILEQATAKYGDEVADTTALTKSRFQAAYQDFQATWGKVINRVLVPVLETLTDIFVSATHVMQVLFGISEETISQNDAIETSVENQKELTKAVEETEKAQKKAVASFDTLNVIQSQTASSLDIKSNSSVVDALKSTQSEIKNTGEDIGWLQKKFDEFWYEYLGKIDLTAVLNLENSWLKYKNSLIEYWETIEFPSLNIDFTTMAADYANAMYDALSAVFTAGSGWMNVQSSAAKKDFEGIWSGIGRIFGGAGQMATLFAESMGLESAELLRETYYPITEEIENLYKGLSVEAAKSLNEYRTERDKIMVGFRSMVWGKDIVSNENLKSFEKGFDKMIETALGNSEEILNKGIADIHALVEEGFLTPEQAKESISKLETVYATQEKKAKENRDEIFKILGSAYKQERTLTETERAKITELMRDTDNDITEIISVGAGDRTEINRILNENEEAMSSRRLSQVIQFANSEYDATVKKAKEKRDETIEIANRQFKELGTISEEQYNDIVDKANKTYAEEISGAEKTRKELVKKAQQQAGEIAKTVDPETGEILSNWEVTWNNMYETVKSFINKIIGKINEFVKNVSSPLLGVGNWAASLLGLPEVRPFQIPMLAKGAVIPPNKAFLSVLGDQKNGRNLEAPENLIRQIVREETANNKQNFIVEARGSLAPLIRYLNLQITEENNRASVF